MCITRRRRTEASNGGVGVSEARCDGACGEAAESKAMHRRGESSVSPLDRASQWNSPSTGDLLQRYNLDSEPDFTYLRNIMENQSVADNLFN